MVAALIALIAIAFSLVAAAGAGAIDVVDPGEEVEAPFLLSVAAATPATVDVSAGPATFTVDGRLLQHRGLY